MDNIISIINRSTKRVEIFCPPSHSSFLCSSIFCLTQCPLSSVHILCSVRFLCHVFISCVPGYILSVPCSVFYCNRLPLVFILCLYPLFIISVYILCLYLLFIISVYILCLHSMFISSVYILYLYLLFISSVYVLCLYSLFTSFVYVLCPLFYLIVLYPVKRPLSFAHTSSVNAQFLNTRTTKSDYQISPFSSLSALLAISSYSSSSNFHKCMHLSCPSALPSLHSIKGTFSD